MDIDENLMNWEIDLSNDVVFVRATVLMKHYTTQNSSVTGDTSG